MWNVQQIFSKRDLKCMSLYLTDSPNIKNLNIANVSVRRTIRLAACLAMFGCATTSRTSTLLVGILRWWFIRNRISRKNWSSEHSIVKP
ncbi:unnamed protein product [Haemonchus placei]|uniref:Uncharacterized protein n=1 Tax=Haemonchus placei TaxID=6290 RepID=A0A0N4VVP7_HAEPC|nr:unnamed protein product [Haemonchus placei]